MLIQVHKKRHFVERQMFCRKQLCLCVTNPKEFAQAQETCFGLISREALRIS